VTEKITKGRYKFGFSTREMETHSKRERMFSPRDGYKSEGR
jgi:hypothetical protein